MWKDVGMACQKGCKQGSNDIIVKVNLQSLIPASWAVVCRWFKGGRWKLCLEVSYDTVVNVWTVWKCEYSSVFGVLKWSMKSVSTFDVSPCDVIPRPFLAILECCKQSKSESGEELGTRLCILFAVSNSNSACCQDYAACHFLRLLHSFQSLITSSCSWSTWTLYHLRQPNRSRLGPTKTQCWV